MKKTRLIDLDTEPWYPQIRFMVPLITVMGITKKTPKQSEHILARTYTNHLQFFIVLLLITLPHAFLALFASHDILKLHNKFSNFLLYLLIPIQELYLLIQTQFRFPFYLLE